LHRYAGKKFEYYAGTVRDKLEKEVAFLLSLLFFVLKVHDDSEFHALLESTIAFSKRSFSDEKVKKLVLMTGKKSSL
jgi:hypothetical protein